MASIGLPAPPPPFKLTAAAAEIDSMLAAETSARGPGLTVAAFGWLGIAFASAVGYQSAVIAGSRLHAPLPRTYFSSTLLSNEHSGAHLASVLAHNLPWLAGMAVLAWPLARFWSSKSSERRILVARGVYAAVTLATLIALWWIISSQAADLAQTVSSRWVLFLALPHGPIEFAGLFLPLVAALDCRRRETPPGRSVLSALALALPLVVLAALIEVYVSPELLTLPNLQ
jgi:hypothetical protein